MGCRQTCTTGILLRPGGGMTNVPSGKSISGTYRGATQMSGDRGRRGRYSYTYHAEPVIERDLQQESALSEDMRFIAETIASLTGGCEICKNSVASFCQVHHHSALPGDPRCDDFVRRLPEDPGKAAKQQVQAYVNQTLGISKRNLLRMTDPA